MIKRKDGRFIEAKNYFRSYEEVIKNRKYTAFNKKLNKNKLTSFNLSSSGDFKACPIKDIKEK